jgi:hypothetical protein
MVPSKYKSNDHYLDECLKLSIQMGDNAGEIIGLEVLKHFPQIKSIMTANKHFLSQSSEEIIQDVRRALLAHNSIKAYTETNTNKNEEFYNYNNPNKNTFYRKTNYNNIEDMNDIFDSKCENNDQYFSDNSVNENETNCEFSDNSLTHDSQTAQTSQSNVQKTCFICKSENHFMRNCPQNTRKDNQNSKYQNTNGKYRRNSGQKYS